jgi:hypothetical protein
MAPDGGISPPSPSIRLEVRTYLKACENLIEGVDESAHDRFLDASTALQRKTGMYTDEELTLVAHMMHRVSDMFGDRQEDIVPKMMRRLGIT